MPLYVLKCKKCGAKKEVLLARHGDLKYAMRITLCEVCGTACWEKLPTIPVVRFKGWE